MEGMPTDIDGQDRAVLETFFSRVKHISCDDGTYYIVVTDMIKPNNGITGAVVRPGSPEFSKVEQLVEKGYADLEEIKERPKLRSV